MFRPRLVLSRAMSRQPPGCTSRRRRQPHHLAIKDVTVTQVNWNLKPEVRVIEDVQSATDVIERVRNDGVVGLGVQGQGPGLVQLREVSGEIHIFRTGRNRSLLQKGSGLKDMLEDPSTLKVVHSCGCANEAFWSHGIRQETGSFFFHHLNHSLPTQNSHQLKVFPFKSRNADNFLNSWELPILYVVNI